MQFIFDLILTQSRSLHRISPERVSRRPSHDRGFSRLSCGNSLVIGNNSRGKCHRSRVDPTRGIPVIWIDAESSRADPYHTRYCRCTHLRSGQWSEQDVQQKDYHSGSRYGLQDDSRNRAVHVQ
jgi:hypothetical protein